VGGGGGDVVVRSECVWARLLLVGVEVVLGDGLGSIFAFARVPMGVVLLIPEICPGGQRLTCGPTLSTNQMRPWD